MPTPISISIGTLTLPGQLNDSATAATVAALLPLEVRMSRWGEEYYGAIGGKSLPGSDAESREEMAVGELAYWPPGNALCLFFGPTPVSVDDQPRAASPVIPVGTFHGDFNALKRLGSSVEVTLNRQETNR